MLTGPRIDYPLGGRVDALVARWAQDTPEATALTWRGAAISYRELCRSAEGERQNLVAQGIGAGDIVAVRLPRGPHLVAVLLGVLAAGAAYAGGAVDWPRSRFDDIAERCGAKLVVDEDTPQAPHAAEPLAVTEGAPDDPCCVFSTSGSSGHPRAVLTPHSGTARIAFDPLLGFDGDTHMLQISPLGWDIMSMELWAPLINGGISALYDGGHPGPQELRAQVAAGVDTVWLTTSLFNALVEEDPHCLAGLRNVITGGEKISPGHVVLLRAALPALRLVNGYGPVESTVLATGYEIPETVDGSDIPIGVPLANTQVLLRDNEIVLAGDGLGTGYLGDPEATAERFQQDGYHTGDLGRVDEHGVLYFAGRADRQFKIRGARIAPEEVEAVMDALPGVHRSVLLPAPNGTETVACYLGTAEPDAVRAHLADRFPDGFVPRIVRALESMPRNVNGKLDTAALLALVTQRPRPETSPSDGEQDAAARIAAECADLLGVPVDRDTDLIDAGANSINVIRLAGRLKVGAGVVLSQRTPAGIAAELDGTAEQPATNTPEPDPTRWVANLPMTQYRMWWAEQHTPGAPEVIYPLQFRITGPLDTAALAGAVRAVAARHDALHTRLRARSHRHVVALPAAEPPECAVAEHDPDAVYAFRTAPFDLDAAPPIRARIFRRHATEHLLVLAVHNTAFDGWSEAILCRDLAAAYAGAELPQAPGYRDVAWQQAIAAPPVDRFWHEHLRDVPELPLGRVVPGAGPVAELELPLPAAPTAEYLAAWVHALRAETGATDFALRMPLGGRTLPAADDVIGCFAASAAVRFPAAVRTQADCVAHANRLLQRLLADQHVPLERIAAERTGEPTGRNPLCQAAFSMQNMDHAVLELPGLTVHRVRPPHPDSAFELSLELYPAEQRAVLWHRTDVVSADRAAALGDAWQAALRARLGVPA